MAILEAFSISKKYYRKRSDSTVFYPVKETDFSLESGCVTVVSGASGSGKSTLLHMLAGILAPSSGKILLKNQNLYEMDDKELSLFRNHHIGVVPQGQSAVSSLTLYENILLPYSLYEKQQKQSFEKISFRIQELLTKMGIEELKDILPSELSGGELRRMAIARAMVNDPDLILADEPTSDLDEENTKLVLKLFREAAQDGKAVLLVTHDNAVMQEADQLYQMADGVLTLV